ncbi:hypothetical protein GCM10010136_14590 [Limoniibacter endophyticus]|uniref:Uncharacterized protein n=1 Tax=Limoniibacter endophyticus TaxID=1565040 RepID=A0A8J3DGW1_9HYPH|nr:hypothetical protein GCM10010136_14590 [Limoniibacter endophyticus]
MRAEIGKLQKENETGEDDGEKTHGTEGTAAGPSQNYQEQRDFQRQTHEIQGHEIARMNRQIENCDQ